MRSSSEATSGGAWLRPATWIRERVPDWKVRLVTPGEPTLVLVVAAIVGVFAGLATGLFANAINFFHLLFFRTATFAQVFSLGPRGDAWRARFLEELLRTRWHVEYLVVGGAAIAAALVLDRIARLTPITPGERIPGGERPFRTIAELLAVGI